MYHGSENKRRSRLESATQTAGSRHPEAARRRTNWCIVTRLNVRAWPLLTTVVVTLAGGRGYALAQPAPATSTLQQPGGRIELWSGVAFLGDRQTNNGMRTLDANGITGTQGRLFALWYPDGSRIGVSAAAAIERFALDRPALAGQASGATGKMAFTDIEASLALNHQRVSANGRLAAEGRAGYAFTRIPVMDIASDRSGQASSVQSHGPQLGAAVAVLLSGDLALEATGSVIPVSFGSSYEGAAADARRFSAGARLVAGHFVQWGIRWSALIGYDFGNINTSGPGFDNTRMRHRIGLGLRMAFGGVDSTQNRATRAPIGPSERDSILGLPTRARKPAEAPGRILGIVRGGGYGTPSVGDLAVPNIVIEVHATPLARTAADGSFAVEQVGPGPIVLRLIGEGWKPLEEVINVPPGKDVAVVFLMQKATTLPPASITGLVSAEDGKPVAAQISIPEINLKLVASADGSFIIRVPAGSYTVTIEAPGFEAQTKTVTVGTGEQSIYNVDLHKAAP